MEKTSSGMQENVAGLLCYVLGWVTGLIFFLIEKENKFVRFHAMQSIVAFGALSAFSIAASILGRMPFVGIFFSIANGIIGLIAFILWIVLMVKASQGTKYKLPWAGNLAEKWSGENAP